MSYYRIEALRELIRDLLGLPDSYVIWRRDPVPFAGPEDATSPVRVTLDYRDPKAQGTRSILRAHPTDPKQSRYEVLSQRDVEYTIFVEDYLEDALDTAETLRLALALDQTISELCMLGCDLRSVDETIEKSYAANDNREISTAAFGFRAALEIKSEFPVTNGADYMDSATISPTEAKI